MSKEKGPRVRRLVVKVGSSTVAGENGGVKASFLKAFCRTVAGLAEAGTGVVVVSSGAIALGRPLLGCPLPLQDLPTKQACAAAGQPVLMRHWVSEFGRAGLKAAQVLITREDFQDRRRYLNARETLVRLLQLGAVPIVNENDTVAVEEIQFGDNDNLASFVAGLVGADLLVLLTDVQAVYDCDPRKDSRARAINEIGKVTDDLLCAAGEAGAIGRGGMRSKLLAARAAQQFGIPTIIAKGDIETLGTLAAGRPAGTLVKASDGRMTSRKRWIAHALVPSGEIRVDPGAAKALTSNGKSLLPRGVVGIRGDFQRGDLVEIRAIDNKLLGKGLVCYSAQDILRISGRRSSEIKTILGYSFGDEIVHRDDMVVDK
jgi:glutamate 5-kinase